MGIRIFGDSHAYSYLGIEDARINCLGPITMHRIGRDGIDALDIRRYGIKNGDILVFIFGEIDARCHLGRIRDEENRDIEGLVAELVDSYFNAISVNRAFFNNVVCIIRFVTPPSDIYKDADFPFYGSISDRVRITRLLNERLKYSCSKHSFYYLDGYADFAGENGVILPEYLDNTIHLNGKAQPQLKKNWLN